MLNNQYDCVVEGPGWLEHYMFSARVREEVKIVNNTLDFYHW